MLYLPSAFRDAPTPLAVVDKSADVFSIREFEVLGDLLQPCVPLFALLPQIQRGCRVLFAECRYLIRFDDDDLVSPDR